jgi:hypothetical protein
MKAHRVESKDRPDRLATWDEIRAAVCFLPDYLLEYAKASLHEAPSDLGGYVNIGPEELESIVLLEQLDDTVN